MIDVRMLNCSVFSLSTPNKCFTHSNSTPYLLNTRNAKETLIVIGCYTYLHANFLGQIFITEHDLQWVVVRSLCAVRYMRDLYFNQIAGHLQSYSKGASV